MPQAEAALARAVAADPLLTAVAAAAGGDAVSLVGGAVRDVLLGRSPGPDLDLLVEGDATGLARRLGRALSAPVQVHERFGTAALEPSGGRRLDLVSARRERYPAPGALPEVEPGSLADDLARRDFAINAIAYRLSGAAAGRLADPHDGIADLAAGLVRTLRADAFAEDPSRVVRAARYAGRLGFRLEPATAAAAAGTAARLDPASARVAGELTRLLQEPAAAAGIGVLRALGVPWVSAAPADELAARFAALDRASRLPGAPPGPASWALRLGLAVGGEALERMAVPGWARATARSAREGSALAAAIGELERPSQVDAALRAAAPAAALAAAAAGAAAVPRWWAQDRDVRPAISGADLIRAGVAPGPAIGRALAAVRAALLDDEVGGREQQLELALRAAGR